MDTNSNSTTNNTRKRKLSLSNSRSLFNIDVIPSEILVHIFSHLGFFGDGYRYLTAVELVCKRWHQLCVEPSVWESISLSLLPQCFPQNVKKLLNPKFSKVHSLQFGSEDTPWRYNHFLHLVFDFQNCSQCLETVSQLSERERLQLASILHHITNLKFAYCLIETKFESILNAVCNLPKLKSLNILDRTFVGQHFEHITNLAPTLKNLEFSFKRYHYSSRELMHLQQVSSLTNLETLEMRHFPSSEDLSLLTKLSKLKVLKFDCLSGINQVFFERLSTLTQISTLGLHFGDSWRKFKFEHTLSQPLPKLKELAIFDILPERFIAFLTPFLFNLEEILFEDLQLKVSISQIEEMISLSPHLRKVIFNCKEITQIDRRRLTEKYQGRITFQNVNDGIPHETEDFPTEDNDRGKVETN
eukprot:TRINITY_DN4371_c0_g4_i3.p1 TRINITY_DN4371_c0_g4~~TRINITY_DN4371_c0_g4_i3.p1  ORF type:complete len:415 (-),score=62.92 TRINITY_DN4371_c0_g4_i3:144-1388(-)